MVMMEEAKADEMEHGGKLGAGVGTTGGVTDFGTEVAVAVEVGVGKSEAGSGCETGVGGDGNVGRGVGVGVLGGRGVTEGEGGRVICNCC